MKRIIFSILFLFGVAGTVCGQQDNNVADKTLRGSGRVNSSTLGMEIDIPLGSYPGRGINVPISLSYSSKLWRMKYTGDTPGGIVTGGCRSLNVPKFAENSASGWTTSLAVPYIEYIGKDQLYTNEGHTLEGSDQSLCDPNAPPPPNNMAAWVRRLAIHLPSGEVHELRADDTPVIYDRSSTCPPANGYGCDPNSYWLQENWNRTFYAVDGSNLRYVEDSTTNTYRLLMPDGSFYDFANAISYFNESTNRKATKFTDRNANFTTYNDQTGAWTDTLGRTLTAPIGTEEPTAPTPTGSPIVYEMPGMTGSYKFHWKYLKGASASESALTDFNQDLKYRGDKIQMIGNGNWSVRPAGTYLFGSEWNAYVLSGTTLFNPVVLTEIELPTGQKYKFSYDVFGRIEKIIYPTGGEEKFQYAIVATLSMPGSTDVSHKTNHGVVNRKIYETIGDPTPYEWTYSAGYVLPQGYVTTINKPDGTKTERLLHQGNGPCEGCTYGSFGYDNGLAGMAYEERSFDKLGTLVTRTLRQWTKKTFSTGGNDGADWHPRVTQEESIIYDSTGSGVSATTTYAYEGDLNLRESPVLVNKTTQYAFEVRSGGGSFAPLSPPCDPSDPECEPEPSPTPTPLPTPSLTPIRTTETTYSTNGAYLNQNMAGLATSSQVKDSAGTVVSRSETLYDESGRSPGYRGNPTTSKVWDSTKGAVTNPAAYISTSARFDQWGNQYESTDAKGNTATTTFDSTHHAYPIQVTSAVPDPTGQNGSNTAFVTTATFDPITGLPLTTTDVNGIETRITYDPVTLRPQNTKTYFNNVQVGSIAETIYHDEPNNFWVKNRAQIDADKWTESITYFDGLGRAYKAEEVNSNGNVFVEKEFDADGRVMRVSNPFRAGETKVWTTNVYDEASRVKEVILQDGATVKTDYGVSVTAPIGVTKQITDQAGKKRKGISDALGRMVRVIEDPSGQALNTDYVFDTLGNLRKTIQGEQSRYFSHDSLGRLLRAKQPEQDVNPNLALPTADPITGHNQWSAAYSYDDNGNTSSTTDARNQQVTATYDNMNRLKKRDYVTDAATPDVEFYYDGKYRDINNDLQTATGSGKGKTTGVKSSVSRTNYTSFDDLGRLLAHQQITDGITYSTSYTYNLSGGLVSETYPSTRVVNYDFNTDGNLSRVWGQESSTVTTYANAFNYNSSGAVEKLRLGNGKWETAAYNSRLQVTQIGLGAGSNDTSLLKLEFGYGDSTQNNGSMRSQKISFTGLTQPFEQTYIYDDLNRLQVAEEKVGQQTTWKQTFTIDRYGNREFDAANTTTLGSCPQAVCNPDISTANNRISQSGYIFDANGNLTQDAQGQRFGYDAENHQKEFFAIGNGSILPDATYQYDGDGRRVKKISSTETTVFVYNAGGKLVAEYSTQIAQTPQVSYLTTDHLGSPRVVTNQLGAVKDRKDFSAFGEETVSAQRSSNVEYSAADQLRKNYTGYEKDGESGLEFAQARYYNPKHGRYTSIDPLTASANVKNPQTFNRYSYVLNSPYKYTDPLGLLPQGRRDNAGTCGAEHSSCSDDWGSTWDDEEEVPEQQDTEEGVAANHEAAHTDQQHATEPEPPPPPVDENQDSQTPTNIIVTVGAQKTYNGDQIEFPNGAKSEEKYYGFGIVNKITVVDEKGKPIEADSGVTLREDIELISADPDDAKNITGKSQKNDLSFNPDEPGVIYDKVGPLSTNPDQSNVLKEVPKFSVTYRQTLTVKDSQGREILRQKNTITVTNSSVQYKVGKAYVPTRYTLMGY